MTRRVLLAASYALACVMSIATASSTGPVVPRGAGGAGFPPSIYPPPASFPHWGPPNGCANTVGLQPPRATPAPALLTILGQFGTISEQMDLRLSDRALWPLVRDNWRGARAPTRTPTLTRANVSVRLGRRSPFAGLIARNCGRRLLDDSIWVDVCRSAPLTRCRARAAALINGLFVLQRHGRLLIWWSNP